MRGNSGIRKVMVVRVFVAGGAGAIGHWLVPQLLAGGHQVTATTTAGGKAPALARSINGAEKVARVLASISPWLVRIDVRSEPREVNGQPGAVFRDRDNKVLAAVTLDVLDGRIQTIRSVSNPDKLGHVGPVADAGRLPAR
jgi:RNA polymerase sigma-70 factor (ECF subfamily)